MAQNSNLAVSLNRTEQLLNGNANKFSGEIQFESSIFGIEQESKPSAKSESSIEKMDDLTAISLLEATDKINTVAEKQSHIDYYLDLCGIQLLSAELDIFINGIVKATQFELKYMYNFKSLSLEQQSAISAEDSLSLSCWDEHFKQQVKDVNPMEYPVEYLEELKLMTLADFIECMDELS